MQLVVVVVVVVVVGVVVDVVVAGVVVVVVGLKDSVAVETVDLIGWTKRWHKDKNCFKAADAKKRNKNCGSVKNVLIDFFLLF